MTHFCICYTFVGKHMKNLNIREIRQELGHLDELLAFKQREFVAFGTINCGSRTQYKAEIYDEGIKYFRKAARFRNHPDYIDRLIAHAYRQKGDIQSEYEEWVKLQNVLPDHESHQRLVRDHLIKAKEKLELLKQAKEVKMVRRKTFYLIDGEWVDSEYQKEMKVISIKYDTPAYNELLSLRSEWKEYFGLGTRVLYSPDDLALRVGPEGKEVLSPEDLEEIKKHY